MPPLPSHHPHRRTDSQSSTYPRASILPSQSQAPASFGTTSHASAGSTSMSAAKTRQYAHLHAQLAQLNANLADTENLLRMTAVQAGDMRFLGGYIGAMFMGSAKILGEEGVKGNAEELEKDGKSGGAVGVKEESEED